MAEQVDELLTRLRAAAEPTRLRLLALLARSELTVSELTQILRQSQPRVSRHLKLLTDAGLVTRHREGSWVFYRRAESGQGADLAERLIELLPPDDPGLGRDVERLEAARAARAEQAAAYFRTHASEWNEIRALYTRETDVEEALLRLGGSEPVRDMLDLGTGTGRMLEVFAAGIERGVGIDTSRDMLSVARVNLEKAGLSHCHVRQGDIFDLPFEAGSVDLVVIHQVLHYLEDPGAAVAEAARVLSPGGRLLIADFAPHHLEYLREAHAHRRLGFADREVAGWFRQSGLQLADTTHLPPGDSGGDQQLTVAVWAGVRTGARTAPHRKGLEKAA